MEFPDVELKAHTGEVVNPKKYEKAAVYFFPKAFTSGCTREAIRFNELYDEFKAAGFEIFGVSVDGVDTLRKFAEKYGLRFKLLSDEGGALARRLGILRPTGTAERVTYVLKSGSIAEVLRGLKSADQHADKALEVAKRI
jgi:peroxiredoxin Q/BCP